jgi:hypothetical protein
MLLAVWKMFIFIQVALYTGRFVIFSVITNIYNKETKGPALMDLFTVTVKLKFLLQLEMFDVCTTGDTAHIGTIFKWRISMLPCLYVFGKNLNIVSICAVSPMVYTSNISSCQKKPFLVFLWLWTVPLTF